MSGSELSLGTAPIINRRNLAEESMSVRFLRDPDIEMLPSWNQVELARKSLLSKSFSKHHVPVKVNLRFGREGYWR